MSIFENVLDHRGEYKPEPPPQIEDFKASLQRVATELFEEYPQLENFGWTQETPFFNDGDPCVLSVGIRKTGGYADVPEFYDGIIVNGIDYENEVVYTDDEEYWIEDLEREDLEELGLEIDESISETEWYKDVMKRVGDAIYPFKTRGYDIGDIVFLAVFGNNARVTVTREGIIINESLPSN